MDAMIARLDDPTLGEVSALPVPERIQSFARRGDTRKSGSEHRMAEPARRDARKSL